MWSMKCAVALVCAAVVLVGAGCSSGGAGGSTTSSTAPGPGPSVTSTSGTSSTSSTYGISAITSTADPAVDPETWKSDVIVKISRDLKGGDAGGAAGRTTISDDGRYVAFESNAADMVPGDGHGTDIFVFDRQTGVMELVSIASDGARANGECSLAVISATGRWVVFQSEADNLAADDTNKATDVFLRDRQTGSTELVSVGPDGRAVGGGSARGVSADGRYVSFCSASADLVPADTNQVDDVFVRDMQTGVTERVSVSTSGKQANKGSWDCTLSRDGRIVAFQSEASNLVPADTNGVADIFVRDRDSGITERVSVNDAGEEANNNSWDISVNERRPLRGVHLGRDQPRPGGHEQPAERRLCLRPADEDHEAHKRLSHRQGGKQLQRVAEPQRRRPLRGLPVVRTQPGGRFRHQRVV